MQFVCKAFTYICSPTTRHARTGLPKQLQMLHLSYLFLWQNILMNNAGFGGNLHSCLHMHVLDGFFAEKKKHTTNKQINKSVMCTLKQMFKRGLCVGRQTELLLELTKSLRQMLTGAEKGGRGKKKELTSDAITHTHAHTSACCTFRCQFWGWQNERDRK